MYFGAGSLLGEPTGASPVVGEGARGVDPSAPGVGWEVLSDPSIGVKGVTVAHRRWPSLPDEEGRYQIRSVSVWIFPSIEWNLVNTWACGGSGLLGCSVLEGIFFTCLAAVNKPLIPWTHSARLPQLSASKFRLLPFEGEIVKQHRSSALVAMACSVRVALPKLI